MATQLASVRQRSGNSSVVAIMAQSCSHPRPPSPPLPPPFPHADTATSQDGFQLNLLRIPRASPKGVVFLQHGLMDSSDTWLLNGPGVSLGFLLYDAGYDVFLGNSRGNQYSPPPGDDYNWNFDQMVHPPLPQCRANQSAH